MVGFSHDAQNSGMDILELLGERQSNQEWVYSVELASGGSGVVNVAQRSRDEGYHFSAHIGHDEGGWGFRVWAGEQ